MNTLFRILCFTVGLKMLAFNRFKIPPLLKAVLKANREEIPRQSKFKGYLGVNALGTGNNEHTHLNYIVTFSFFPGGK